MENKVVELELQKATAKHKAKQDETKVAALEAQKASLEVLLKVENEQRTDIKPLTKHALMLRNKIYQMQLQIADEMLQVRQVEARLEEIVSTTSHFKDKTQDILEIIQGCFTWLETTNEPPANAPIKDSERVKLEYELIELRNKSAEELVKET